MINVIFYDLPRVHADLLPMTFTRPVADFRIGITTIREKWAMMLPQDCRYGYRTVGFLVKKYKAEEIDDNLFIAGNVVPNPALVEEVLRLEIGEALFKGNIYNSTTEYGAKFTGILTRQESSLYNETNPSYGGSISNDYVGFE